MPVLKSPLSAGGHKHPVYAMSMVGTQNANNLISVSTDGLLCSWQLDMLAQPLVRRGCSCVCLHDDGNRKRSNLRTHRRPVPRKSPSRPSTFPTMRTPTCGSVRWTAIFTMYFVKITRERTCCRRSEIVAHTDDRKAGISAATNYKGHGGPVTAIHFHPLSGPVDFSEMLLTSSVDWTVQLWKIPVWRLWWYSVAPSGSSSSIVDCRSAERARSLPRKSHPC